MKAAYIEKCGSPDEIKFGELPQPEAGPNQVLVRVSAVTVDPIDTYIRSGAYKIALKFPFIIGRDMVGVVDAVGASVKGFAVGDKVWCNNQGYAGRQGTFAEYIASDASLLYKVPDEVDPINVLCCAHSALTVVLGLIGKAGLQKGQSLFINGGSGNVGNLAIQLAKHLGARVATTAGSPTKRELCTASGADFIIDYHTDSIEAKLPEFAPNGVDVFWDLTKTPDIDKAMALTKPRGKILLSSGIAHRTAFNVGTFYTHNLSMYGFTITDLTDEQLGQWAVKLNELFAQGAFKGHVAREFKLADAAEAHRLAEHDSLAGKIVLRC